MSRARNIAGAAIVAQLISCQALPQRTETWFRLALEPVVRALNTAEKTAWTDSGDIEAMMRAQLKGSRVALNAWILIAPWVENLPETTDIVYWLWNDRADTSLVTVGCGKFGSWWSGVVQYEVSKESERLTLKEVSRAFTREYDRAPLRYTPWAPNDARLTKMTVYSSWWNLCDALPNRIDMKCTDETVKAYPATVQPRFIASTNNQDCVYDAKPADVAVRTCTVSIPRGEGLSPLELPTNRDHHYSGSARPCRSSVYFFEDRSKPVTCYQAGVNCGEMLLLDPGELPSSP